MANDFLPFGTAAGSYVLSQSAWAGYSNRGSGYPAGLVPKEPFNKGLRQGTVMAAMLGQFISDAGFDALDNGDLGTLQANFILALATHSGTALTEADFDGAGKNQLGDPGWQFFPGGLLLQWVHGTISGPGAQSVAWPIAFPNVCFGAVISAETAALPKQPPTIVSKNVSGCVIDSHDSSDTPYCFIITLGH